MKRLIVEKKIAEKINTLQKGSILFVNDFLDLGSSESIKKALFRLKEKGVIISLAHGIYLYPEIDKDLGILHSSADQIAVAIAKRDRATIMPTGVQALNRLGLSTQVPMKFVFLTDGSSRVIKIGNTTIRFKKTSPKNLSLKGEISSLVIMALKSIGQNNIEQNELIKISNILKNEKREMILHDANIAPAWIRKILMRST